MQGKCLTTVLSLQPQSCDFLTFPKQTVSRFLHQRADPHQPTSLLLSGAFPVAPLKTIGGTSYSILWFSSCLGCPPVTVLLGRLTWGQNKYTKILSKHIWPFHGLQYLVFKSHLNPHFGTEPGDWLPAVRRKDSQTLCVCKPGFVLSDLTLKEANEAHP